MAGNHQADPQHRRDALLPKRDSPAGSRLCCHRLCVPPRVLAGDCRVNVLDMINVRNHLYDDVGSGDNWRYDLTGDGMINVLDMLAVRNNVRNRCPE